MSPDCPEYGNRGAHVGAPLNEIFRLTGIERFGLATPYTEHVQSAIVKNYADAGFHCIAERHLRKRDISRFPK